MAFFDLTLETMWNDAVGFFSDDNEDAAAAEIANETQQAEAASRQEAAPAGSGGVLTGGFGLPPWLLWVGGGVALLLAFRFLR